MNLISSLLRASAILHLLMLHPDAIQAQVSKYQAESETYVGASFSNAHGNFEGTGFVDFNSQGGGWIEWDIPIANDGVYDLGVRYAVDGEDRPLNLLVDGVTVDTYEMLATPTWDTWVVEVKTVSLSAGTRKIRLQVAGNTGPNVDSITVTTVSTSNVSGAGTDSFTLEASPASIVLESNARLGVNEFRFSPNGAYSIGLDGSGDLVVRAGSQEHWSAGIGNGGKYLNMQGDGNLVVTNDSGFALWSSSTHGNPRAVLVISNAGKAAIVLGSETLYMAPPTISFPIDGYQASIAIPANQELEPDRFISSPNKEFEIGLDGRTGDLIFREGTQLIWSAGVSGATKLSMQIDGNLVLYDASGSPLWATGTNGNDGAYFVITNGSQAAVVVGVTPIKYLFQGSSQMTPPPPPPTPTRAPQAPPAPAPTRAPLPPPAPAPTPVPVASDTRGGTLLRDGFPAAVVLGGNGNFGRGGFVSSPNGRYRVELTNGGDLVLFDGDSVVWNAGVSGGVELFQQTDGNLVINNGSGGSPWTSRTSGNGGARFLIDDGGQVAVVLGVATLWLAGTPRGSYIGPSSSDLNFPIRTMFYYPWYPQTWTVGGKLAHHEPLRGFYSSDDPSIVADHIDQLDYAHTDLSVASWWGKGTNSDRARLAALLDETTRSGSPLKWTVYYEDEYSQNPSVETIKADLDYLKAWYAWHPAWGHKDGKPIIFVYNEGGCDVAERWRQASNNEWYVVLKVFGNYQECENKVDSWHQYGPATDVINLPASFCISPGFWLANQETPVLPRVGESEWIENVKNMVASSAPWHIVTTFNEAGEGTMLESSFDWTSGTRYGYYLDALNNHY